MYVGLHCDFFSSISSQFGTVVHHKSGDVNFKENILSTEAFPLYFGPVSHLVQCLVSSVNNTNHKTKHSNVSLPAYSGPLENIKALSPAKALGQMHISVN